MGARGHLHLDAASVERLLLGSQGRASPRLQWTRSQSNTESNTDQVRRLTNRFGLSQDDVQAVGARGHLHLDQVARYGRTGRQDLLHLALPMSLFSSFRFSCS